MEYIDYREIIKIIAKAGSELQTVEIYYPATENSIEAWREVEPYSLSTDIGEDGEHLIYGKEEISPGHIFNAYTVKSDDKHCDSFIVGKIKDARLTGNKFIPRNNWEVEF